MSFDLVKEFNTTFGVTIRDTPNARVREASMRFELIREEFDELYTKGIKKADLTEVADALGDIVYVVIGAAQVFGMEDIVIHKYDFLMKEDSEEGTDLSTNPLFTVEGHEDILKDLSHRILTNDVDWVSSTLATILYLVSLAERYFKIDVTEIVEAIHESNMTKLGEDGKPIYRESDGKVLKGPNFEEPTADIEMLLYDTDAVTR